MAVQPILISLSWPRAKKTRSLTGIGTHTGRILTRRREFLKYTAATAVAAPFVRGARADFGVVKVGVVGAKLDHSGRVPQ